MPNLTSLLTKLFNAYDRVLKLFTINWDMHANRRTIIIMLVGGSIIGGVYWYAIRPPDDFPIGRLVTVPEDETLSQIAEGLRRDKVIRSPVAFKVVAYLLGREHDMHAGDYLFKEPKSVWYVTRAVSIGAYGLEPIRVRVSEGATTKEMAKIFADEFQHFNAEHFLTLVQGENLEGYLFPDTYFFLQNVDENTVIKTMRQDFDCHVYGSGDGCVRSDQESLLSSSLQTFGKPVSDVVIMASILEREGTNLDNRRMIAGVLWNRIEKGMPLQVDAAFLYSIGRSTPSLTLKDLRNEDDPYNTYRNKGLPPTAIGSPSLSSLLAAVTPTKTKALFYVSDKSGKTYFSRTYAEHCQNIELYLGKTCK